MKIAFTTPLPEEGFHSGLMATGHYECVGHAEIDPNAAKAYKAIYGEERNIFTLLVSVSGIGPNTARMMLSALTTDEVRMALISGDVNKIKSVKGIGLKTAQRAIIELKDKVGKDGSGATLDLGAGFETNNHREEAFGALITLGFSKAAVEKVLNSILKKEPGCTSEEIIKKALKLL